jgi:solute carrier family 35 protein E1
LKEKHPLKIYLTLLPIVCGVVLATVTELSFNFGGMLSAIFSTMFMSLQTIFSKKVLEDTGIHEFRLLLVMTQLTLLSLVPAWIFLDASKFFEVIWNAEGFIEWNVLFMIASSGFLNFSQNVVAFSMLSTVSSLSYSVANSMKRIVVIGVSLVMLHNPVTPMNVIGMSMAVAGVLVYNKVKSDISRLKHELPIYSSDVDGSVPNGKLLGL